MVNMVLELGYEDILKYLHEKLGILKVAKYRWDKEASNHPLFKAAGHKTKSIILVKYLHKECGYDISLKIENKSILSFIDGTNYKMFEYLYQSDFNLNKNRDEIIRKLVLNNNFTELWKIHRNLGVDLFRLAGQVGSVVHFAVAARKYEILYYIKKNKDELRFNWNDMTRPVLFEADSVEMVKFLDQETDCSLEILSNKKGDKIFDHYINKQRYNLESKNICQYISDRLITTLENSSKVE